MTTEQKALAYDEAIKRAKAMIKVAANQDEAIGFVNTIFREHCEFEDERIRKELLEHCRLQAEMYNTIITGDEYAKIGTWIAWLEKQCHTDGIIEMAKTEKQRVIITETDGNANINWDTRNLEDAKKLLECGLQYINTELAKQGEQKLPIEKLPEEMKTIGESLGFTTQEECEEYNQMVSDLIMSDEKDKPKFKIGDWVVDDCGYILKIEGILNQFYILKGIAGGESRSTIEWANKTFHLWTIKDAKNGDILAGSKRDVILIFRGIGNTEWDDVIDYYCYYDCYRKDFVVQEGLEYWGNTENNQLKPATKGQRDLLFQKMQESGYEWNVVKKELKNIRLQPSQWNVSDFRTWQYVVSDVLTKHDGIGQYLDDGLCKNIAKYMQEEWSKKLSLKQNPAEWSEEDEKILKEIISDVKFEGYNNDMQANSYKKINWLNFLKERYLWKPSDEQMEALYEETQKSDRIKDDRIVSLYNDLKKLKE